MQLYLKHDCPLGLPDLDAGGYFVEWLSADLEWCAVDGMGNLRSHAWTEIDAFDRMLGLGLEPWEARQLRTMSRAYVEGNNRGRKPMVTAPVYHNKDDDPGIALERRVLSDKIRIGMAGAQ